MFSTKNKPIKIYAENIEEEALNQFYEAMKQDYIVKGALMPDAHVGYSLPIGGVVATDGVIVPAYVGYDLGCGCCAIQTTFKKEDIELNRDKIFNQIYRDIPTGYNHNKYGSNWNSSNLFPRSKMMDEIFDKLGGYKQMCSLGSGNHFQEIGSGKNDVIWLIIHSGSRGIGHETAKQYMMLASNTLKAKEGHFPLKLNTKLGQDYLMDMNFCLEFALENRKQMLDRIINIIRKFNCDGEGMWKGLINRNHNHADERDGLMIHRKGATHAEKDMMGVIPGNMKHGSFIVKGKGDPESLYSSSHGAGRKFSRSKAKEIISLDSFKKTMEGITAKVCKGTLDESPEAYKDIFKVMDLQKDLVEICDIVKPIINIKAEEKKRRR